MRIFLLGAIVLIVLAIIATAAASGSCLGVSALTWLCASLLAFFVDLAWGLTVGSGGVVRRQGPPPTV